MSDLAFGLSNLTFGLLTFLFWNLYLIALFTIPPLLVDDD